MRTLSIRTHLLLLVLAVSIPFVATVGFGIYADMQQNIEHTKTTLRILANTMSSNTGRSIANSRKLLESLANRPLVKRVDPKNCDGILKELLVLYPGYANVGYSDMNGLIVCSAIPQPGGKLTNIGKTAWFQHFLKMKRFTVGHPFIGPITGKLVSVLSVPIWNERHEMVGAVLLPLDLKVYDPAIPAQLLPNTSHYGFISDDGMLLWRNIDTLHDIGTRPQSEAAKQMMKLRNGEFESLAADGVKRYYSILSMPEIGWIAWVGVPAATVYAEAKQRAMIAIGASLSAILLLLLLAISIARRITGPVAKLENAAHAIHEGNFALRVEEEGPREIAAVAQEFNAMLNAQQQSVEQLRIAAAAFESQESMIVTDANSVILRINKAFTKTTGYTAGEIVGLKPSVLKSGRHDADFYRTMWETINRTGGWQGEIWDRRKNGEVYPQWLTISAVKNDEGAITHYIGSHFDISSRKQAEKKIHELAFYDQLTNLPNRTLLLDRLSQSMTAGIRTGSYGALLLIDLDNFKTLNDTLGHDMGDLLLKQVARRLSDSIRAEDTVARLGGDEFVVMLVNLSTSKGDASIQVEIISEKIRSALNRTYLLQEVSYHCTSSIGATLFSGHQVSLDELLKQADLAMYKSKESGRNAMCFFDPTMQATVVERAALEAGLRRAIQENQFILHYQAQVDGTNHVIGAEALLRWQHPQRGVVSPAEFIPLAEETRLILPLGHWVMETACTQLAAWATQADMAALTISVNVSAHQFRQPDFVEQVLAILKHTGANPRRLKLELTESLLVKNVPEVIKKMFALQAEGISFSLDDFGTGYSSLSYLKNMPLDQLKIDKSFVRDVLIDSNDAAIAKTVVALAQNMGLGVIAEGVETEGQRAFLESIGCHTYQGYFFSRPVPVEDFEEFSRLP